MGSGGFRSRGDIVHLGRDLDLNLGPLFFFAFEDGGGISGEILELVDGRVAAAARDASGGRRHLEMRLIRSRHCRRQR